MHTVESMQRLFDLRQMAQDTFEATADTAGWLRRLHTLLDGDTPLACAWSVQCALRVNCMLVAIKSGGAASPWAGASCRPHSHQSSRQVLGATSVLVRGCARWRPRDRHIVRYRSCVRRLRIEEQRQRRAGYRCAVNETKRASRPFPLVGIVVDGNPGDEYSAPHALSQLAKQSIDRVTGLALPQHPRFALVGARVLADLELRDGNRAVLAESL